MILWDLIDIKKTKFLIPKICDLAFCRSTDVHKRAQAIWLEGRSTDPVDR